MPVAWRICRSVSRFWSAACDVAKMKYLKISIRTRFCTPRENCVPLPRRRGSWRSCRIPGGETTQISPQCARKRETSKEHSTPQRAPKRTGTRSTPSSIPHSSVHVPRRGTRKGLSVRVCVCQQPTRVVRAHIEHTACLILVRGIAHRSPHARAALTRCLILRAYQLTYAHILCMCVCACACVCVPPNHPFVQQTPSSVHESKACNPTHTCIAQPYAHARVEWKLRRSQSVRVSFS